MSAGIVFMRDLGLLLAVAGMAGWLCKRVGWPSVPGFIAAGLFLRITPWGLENTPSPDHLLALAQIGLIFIVFPVGMRLSLQRLQRLGPGLLSATVVAALISGNVGALIGMALGFGSLPSLFFAGTLMVSSSVIVGRMLRGADLAHERFGQTAIDSSMIETVLALVLLTVATSLTMVASGGVSGVFHTLERLGMFVVLVVVVAMLSIPWILRRARERGSDEIQTLLAVGALFLFSWLASRAGHSSVLGAFLLGLILGSTRHKAEIERFSLGMRNVFGAVFFVVGGMSVNFQAMGGLIWWVPACILTVMVVRTTAVAVGFTLSGRPLREALRIGLALVPIGELSFVFAYLGVMTGYLQLPSYSMVILTALGVAVVAPTLVFHSKAISIQFERMVPSPVRRWVRLYQAWVHALRQRQEQSPFWKLARKRLVQIGVEMVFVSAIVWLARVLLDHMGERSNHLWLDSYWWSAAFWVAVGLFLLIPVLAIWRNLEAMAMLTASALTRGLQRRLAVQSILQPALRLAAFACYTLWLLSLVPVGAAPYLISSLVVLFAAVILLFRRKLILWHSLAEVELNQSVEMGGGLRRLEQEEVWLDRHDAWDLRIHEHILSDTSGAVGQPLSQLPLRARFGCAVVSVERQGFSMPNPPASTQLFPGDMLLLLGPAKGLKRAGAWLDTTVPPTVGQSERFEELQVESITLPTHWPPEPCRLSELRLMGRFGLQVVGIAREGVRQLNPTGTAMLHPGDDLLILGTRKQVEGLRAMIESTKTQGASREEGEQKETPSPAAQPGSG